MSREGAPTQEQVREAYIIDELRNTTPEKLMNMMQATSAEEMRKNAQDPEQIKEYLAWDDEWRSLVQALEGEEGERQILNTELKRADLYIAADLTALARETLESARDIAWAMGFENVSEDIEGRLETLE
ncbi:hypothetical protein KW800_01855 [Candidatus Parcubacteria bacterium]|nr:hypothetical protein [Candidatus Parcubacteria bacterium]